MLFDGCPAHSKKTIASIIDSHNDYLIAVKANQGNLFKLLQAHAAAAAPLSVDTQMEQTRDRQTQRIVTVLEPPLGIAADWVGIRRVIQVERQGTRAHKPYQQTMLYISSLSSDAATFAERIRTHWQIENRLHWVKDVVLREDQAPLCDGHALANFAILRTVACNLFRANGFASVTKGIRYLAHDVHRLFSFFQ